MDKIELVIGIVLSLLGFMLVQEIYAQQNVGVQSTNGSTVQVPTLAEAIENSMQAIIALITAIIAIIGLIVKSGLLDPYLSRKKQDQIYTNVQMGLTALKAVTEDKVMLRQALVELESTIPEEKRPAIRAQIENLTQQINAKTSQINFYYERVKDRVPARDEIKYNPDLCMELPRESHNMANDMAPIPKRIGVDNR